MKWIKNKNAETVRNSNFKYKISKEMNEKGSEKFIYIYIFFLCESNKKPLCVALISYVYDSKRTLRIHIVDSNSINNNDSDNAYQSITNTSEHYWWGFKTSQGVLQKRKIS